MFQKIKSLPIKSTINELRDVRAVGFMVFGIIVLLVSWSTVGIIQTNYDLQKKIAHLEQQNKVADLEAANLKLRNEYFNTDQYLELTARKQFGKAAPGETVMVVTKAVALAHTVEMPKLETAIEKQEKDKASYQKNFEAWMDFLFHPGSNDDI